MTDESLCVALTGASGFVGRYVLRRLLASGCPVRALVRRPDRMIPGMTAVLANLEVLGGDLSDAAAVEALLRGAGAVIHLTGIIRERGRQTFERVHVEGTRRLLAAARQAGVRRWVHMSALGTRADARCRYHQTKWQAEEAVRAAATGAGALRYTIFRPSIIHGPDGEFLRMVRAFWCRRWPPFVPYFGAGALGRGGAGHVQPVWVEDVAHCLVAALTAPAAVGKIYELGGPDVLTWPELYRVCQRHIPGARPKRIIALPAWWALVLARLPGVPFNRDQVIMSQEDSTCPDSVATVRRDFGLELAGFEPTLAGYAGAIE
jgi:NADH dehydrogenase